MILQTSGNRKPRNPMKAKMRKHIKRLCASSSKHDEGNKISDAT